MEAATERKVRFENFDTKATYDESLARVLDQKTRNFVIEFGRKEARIAFDLGAEDVKSLLLSASPAERPVRWINIWAPNRQTGISEALAIHYKFSPRLGAIIQSTPQDSEPPSKEPRLSKSRIRRQHVHKEDVELATTSLDTPRLSTPPEGREETSHYSIAKHMLNYQSIDVGNHFLCIGANFMHGLPTMTNDASIISEGSQKPLWTWLVLCDDNTVITLHEDPGHVNDIKDLSSIRGNTLSVLSQLSEHGHLHADPISMQTVRQALDLDASQVNPGVEGSSNLFYYLFDDWRAVYSTIAGFRKRLEELQTKILGDMTRSSNTAPNIELIPRLHILGRQIRQRNHLYAGYKNLIERILEPKSTGVHGSATPRSLSGLTAGSRGVILAQSASQRFERLADRIQFLILSETQEFLEEKDALISTYFNINAQKDSEASARLTRAATLLAKLSVLFLPVSLMTSIFSVQIPNFTANFTVKTYWDAFAIILCISFVALFFFSKLLMWVTETLDSWVKHVLKWFTRLFRRRSRHDPAYKAG